MTEIEIIKSNPSSRWHTAGWYSIAVIFGIVAGIIIYLLKRRDNPSLAKECLVIGLFTTFIPILWTLVTYWAN